MHFNSVRRHIFSQGHSRKFSIKRIAVKIHIHVLNSPMPIPEAQDKMHFKNVVSFRLGIHGETLSLAQEYVLQHT